MNKFNFSDKYEYYGLKTAAELLGVDYSIEFSFPEEVDDYHGIMLMDIELIAELNFINSMTNTMSYLRKINCAEHLNLNR